jgi:hypothetical protein
MDPDGVRTAAMTEPVAPVLLVIRQDKPIQTINYGGHVYKVGTLEGRTTVITMTGIGMVNAAMTTQQVRMDPATTGCLQLRLACQRAPQQVDTPALNDVLLLDALPPR